MICCNRDMRKQGENSDYDLYYCENCGDTVRIQKSKVNYRNTAGYAVQSRDKAWIENPRK